MTRHPRGLRGALPALRAAALTAALISFGSDRPALADPYYTNPCLDSDGDRIEDYLMQLPDQVVDLFVVFDGPTWDPVATRVEVQQILDALHSTATIRYVGEWSPYVFLDGVDFGSDHQAPEALEAILMLKYAIGARAYERFVLKTSVVGSPIPPTPLPLPHPDESGEWSTGTPSAGTPGTPVGAAPTPVPGPIPIPIPLTPDVLIYVVDSGIDDTDQYWGIDAAVQNPLIPKKARDPKDLTALHHGTFVKRVILNTLAKADAVTPAWKSRHADVRVAVGPEGETTTLELTRGFDAVVAHQKYEQALGRFYRVVVNVSYDTDGPIANHDIIYPRPGGLLDPRSARAALHTIGGPAPAVIGPPPPNPCQVDLFDNVYRILNNVYGSVINVGAGNDGLQAAYIINELGHSGHATIVVAALEPASGMPAGYSCYGSTPGGYLQNGHPDLAAVGTGSAPGFTYLLQGTSIATAYCSGMAGAALLESPNLTPDAIGAWLVAKGSRLPDTGDHWYGAARLHLPWEARLGATGPGAPGLVPTLLFPGPGSRIVVQADHAGPVVVRVFSVAGRLVRTLQDGPLPAGRHELAFDGRGDDGAALAGGLYFVRGTSEGGSDVTKLLIRR